MNLMNNINFSGINTPSIFVKATEKLKRVRRQKSRVTIKKFFSGFDYLLTSKCPVICCDFGVRFSVIKVFEGFIFHPFSRNECRSKVFVCSQDANRGVFLKVTQSSPFLRSQIALSPR